MTVLICTGTEWAHPEQAFKQLVKQGAVATSGSTQTGLDLQQWHDRVIGPVGTRARPGARQLGKAWEQAAGEIFIANWNTPAWGWTDPRSVWLLDFWKEYDPETRFLLCSVDPVSALARHCLGHGNGAGIDGNGPIANADTILETWIATEREMLRFFLRDPERCVWLHTGQHAFYPEETLASRIQRAFGLPPQVSGTASASASAIDAVPVSPTTPATTPAATLDGLDTDPDQRPNWTLVLHLSAQIVAEKPEIGNFYEEILASTGVQQPEYMQSDTPTAAEAWQAITQMQGDRTAVEQQLQAAQDAQSQLDAKLRESKALEGELKEEIELVQGQLDLAREELERYFLHYQDVSKALESVTKARDEAAKARDEAAKARDDATKARDRKSVV